MSFNFAYFVESLQAVFVGMVSGYLVWRFTGSGTKNVK